MDKHRLEAFSDAVIAIILTIMVLELTVPHEPTWEALKPLWPVFLAYVMSYFYLGIYWNNHHHMLHATERVNGPVLLANMHLLFWLSLIPFVTAWMAENHFATVPTALYGVVLTAAALSYSLLQNTIIAQHCENKGLKQAVGRDFKGKLSLLLYIIGTALAFVNEWAAVLTYNLVSLMWLLPDRRIEKNDGHKH